MLSLSNAFWAQAKTAHFQSLSLADAATACGFIRQSCSGLWELDCFGAALAARLDRRMRRTMARLGCHETRFCQMQEQALWDATGRDADYGEELYALKDRRGARMRLAATAEEAASRAASTHLAQSGSRDLWCHQIGTKWRDETRARGALARAREFSMLDAYSFCQTEQGARDIHERCLSAWSAELSKLGLQTTAKLADCGEVGGLESMEITIDSRELGDQDGQLEIAHLFLLGDRYSKAFGLRAKDGQFMSMGCQGIGMSRLLMALLESRRTDIGFRGDMAACSHLFWICGLDFDRDQKARADAMELAETANFDGILDDRDLASGRKLREAEACMAAYRIVCSTRQAAAGVVEATRMSDGHRWTMGLEEAKSFIRETRTADALDN